MNKISRRAIYVYKTAEGTEYTGMALDVHVHTNGNLRFYDTIRGHDMVGELKQQDKNSFIFTMKHYIPGDWHFKILTIEDFKRKYYKTVVNGDIIAAKIHTTDDLHFWYRQKYME